MGIRFGDDVKRNGDHFRVSIISGSIWGSVAVVWNPPVPSQSPAGYLTNIWVGATKGLKPRPCIGQNIPKIHTLSRTIPSILLPCLKQRTKCTPEQTHVTVIARADPQYRKGQDNTRLENFSCRHHQLCIF